MSEPTFPDELVERCAKTLIDVDPCVLGYHETHIAMKRPDVLAVLRESGHAELVAALKDARQYVQSFARWNNDKRAASVLEDIDAALRKAGAL